MKIKHPKPGRSLPGALPAITLLLSGGIAQAALTLKYTFDDINPLMPTVVPNTAPGAPVGGVLVTGNAIAPIVETGPSVTVGGIPYALGKVVRFAPAGDGDGDANTPYIQTNGSLSLWGITGSTQYTAMAWVKFNNQNGDNMVYGNLNGNRLHNGARNANYHSGHWGDDVTGGTTQPGVWHHVTWVNDAGNNQAIYVDGALTVGPGAGGSNGNPTSGDNLVLGTSGNGGSLNGSIDEVKVFNTLLTPAQIQAEMVPTIFTTALIIQSIAGTTDCDNFVATILVKDGIGRVVVPAQITSVTFNGVNAATYSATKVGDITTVKATLAGAYVPGQFTYNIHVIGTDAASAPYDLNQNLAGPILPPPASLAGPFSGDPLKPWGVREYTAQMPDYITAIGTVLVGTAPNVEANTAVVNFSDPNAPTTQGDWNNNILSPGNTAADDDHVFSAKAHLSIPAAGAYTFDIHTDDGVILKIRCANITGVTGGGGADPSDSSAYVNTGVANALVTFNFPSAGTYDVAMVSVDTGGPGTAELSWAAGTWTDERATADWVLVGNPSDSSVPAPSSAFPTNLPGVAGTNGMWGIRTYPTDGFENVENLAAEMAFLSNPAVICWTQAKDYKLRNRPSWVIKGSTVPSEYTLETPSIAVGSSPGSAHLSFTHRHSFEGGKWDGGAVFYSIEGGPFTQLTAFTANGYNGAVNAGGAPALDGLPAFVENSASYGAGALITSEADIPGVLPNEEVSILFKVAGDDGGTGSNPNWHITKVRLTWNGSPVYDSALSVSHNGDMVATTVSGPGAADAWLYDNGTTVVTRTGVVDTLARELNFKDPTTNGGEVGIVLGAQPFPGDTGADNNHIVTVAHSRITIAASGDYTFNNHGDDGFLLRVRAVSGPNPAFRSVSGGGGRTMSAPNEMYFLTGTGDTDTRGIINLPAGQYDLDYATWEGGGGFFYQLTMAQGAFPNNGDTNDWVCVGHMANPQTYYQPVMESQWQVQSTAAGAIPASPQPNIVITEGIIAGATQFPWDVVNFTDPQTNGAGPGRFGADSNWQNNTGADDNYYGIKATGYIHISQEGDYLLGFDGDDGGYLEILGASFSSITENSTGAGTIVSTSGGTNNRLNTDVPTGSSRTTGRIHLVADDYQVNTLMYEIGGGSFFEVYGSAVAGSSACITPAKSVPLTLLRYSAGYDFNNLATIPNVIIDTISSPGLTAKPTADLSLGLTTFSFGAGDSFSLTFPSASGLGYTVEYSTDLTAWYKAGGLYGGAGATSTFNGALSDLNPPLPANAQRVYWRIVGLY